MNTKVLIIGETFRQNGGGGITLINLFRDFEPGSLAVVTDKIHQTIWQPNCDKYYRLGNSEIKFPFPFNLINKISDSGDFKFNNQTNSIYKKPTNKSLLAKFNFNIEIIYFKLLIFTGLISSNYNLKVSENLLQWINDFAPEIIYAQAFRLMDMEFAISLKKKTGLPLAIHIMDDSVSYINKTNLLYAYWKQRINKTFCYLVSIADIRLSISEAMSQEYFKRYQKTFIPFRNPIEISKWEPFLKKNWSIEGEANILYTGRLAVPNIHSLLIFCKAVEVVNNSGIDINLHIYSIDKNHDFEMKTKLLKSVHIHKSVPPSRIPELLSKSDFCFLPIDFTPKGIKYAQFSISTKTSEYMISGVPILLLAPTEVAITSYATKFDCMFLLNDNNIEKIVSGLHIILRNEQLRKRIALNAMKTARLDSDSRIVGKEFYATFKSKKTLNEKHL